MKIFRNSVAAAIITTIILALFAIAINGRSAKAAAITPDAVRYEPVTTGIYNFDPAHTIIGFGVRHLGIAIVEGRFKDFNGTVNYDEKDVTRSTVEIYAKI